MDISSRNAICAGSLKMRTTDLLCDFTKPDKRSEFRDVQKLEHTTVYENCSSQQFL